jgi:transcription antitermination factor NusG
MTDPSDIERRFLAGERSEQVRFAVNDSVRVTSGCHAGRTATVISIRAVEPEVVFVLEPGSPPWGDIEVPQASIELVE